MLTEVRPDAVASSIEYIVPQADDPDTPALTFRALLLGFCFGAFLSLANSMWAFRTNANIAATGATFAVVASYPLGLLWHRFVPAHPFWNPGKFSVKEHVLVFFDERRRRGGADDDDVEIGAVSTNLQSVAPDTAPAVENAASHASSETDVNSSKETDSFMISTKSATERGVGKLEKEQPSTDLEKELEGGYKTTRKQAFWYSVLGMYLYSLVPEYFAPALQAVSFCTSASFAGIVVGNSLTISLPSEQLGESTMPSPKTGINPTLNSVHLFSGNPNAKNHALGEQVDPAYFYDVHKRLQPQHDGIPRTYFAVQYGSQFLTIAAVVAHVGLWYGETIKRQFKSALRQVSDAVDSVDIHNQLMSVYWDPPDWMFLVFAVVMAGVTFCVCLWTPFKMPWWGVLLNLVLTGVLIIPIGVIYAISGISISVSVLAEFLMGSIVPGDTVAVMAFKSLAINNLNQGLLLVGGLKIGHYLHVPPSAVIIAQIFGTSVNILMSTCVTWWMMFCSNMLNATRGDWQYIVYQTFYSDGAIWGCDWAAEVFWDRVLSMRTCCGVFWLGSCVRLGRGCWIVPIIFAFTGVGGFQTAVLMPLIVGFVFQVLIFKYAKEWYQNYTFVMASAFDIALGIPPSNFSQMFQSTTIVMLAPTTQMEPPETSPVQHQQQQQRHCWFFHNGGCRKGEECAFKHDVSLLSAEEKGKGKGKGKKDKNKNNSNSSNLDIEAPICIFHARPLLQGTKVSLRTSTSFAPHAHTPGTQSNALAPCVVGRRRSLFQRRVWKTGYTKKKLLIDEFRRKKGSIACRFFRRSAKRCPFGDKCLYAHNDATGKRKVGVRKPQLSRKLRRERSLMDHDSDGGGGGGDPIVFQDALMGLMTAMESLGLPMNNVQEVQQVLDVMRATDPNLMQRLSRMVRMAPGLFAGGPFRNAGMMDVDEFIHDQFEDGHHYGPFPPYGFHDFGYNNHDGDEDDNGDDYYTTDEEMNEYDTVD
ncbi:OPT oligopeptide transporter protein-domain-containing protein [Obelidium mucronatum]|nr:OPT oligopeptide transporter protein-domain-containing protein [Obelidium mucronatum]